MAIPSPRSCLPAARGQADQFPALEAHRAGDHGVRVADQAHDGHAATASCRSRDSPTMPRISRAPTSNETPSTARSRPLLGAERRRARSRTCEERRIRRGNAHPRIERGIDDVDGRVGGDHEERGIHHGRHDERQVEVLQRVEVSLPTPCMPNTTSVSSAPPPTSAPKSSPNSETKVISEVRSAWRSRTRRLGQALGARGADEVFLVGFDQAGAQHAAVDADIEDRQREPGDHQGLEPAASGPRSAACSRAPAPRRTARCRGSGSG